MGHTPLGEVCLALGLMRSDDVARVLTRLREGGRARFGEIAVELGLLDDEGLARALAHQFRLNMVPRERLDRLSVAPEVIDLLPRGLIRERLLVPTFLDEEKRVLSLLTADPTDIPSLRAAQTSARAARLRLFVAARGPMRDLVDRLLPPEDGEATGDVAAERRSPDSTPARRAITVVFEPDGERAAALKRLDNLEGGEVEVVGDPEQVSAFIEANRAERVFFRKQLLGQVEPYLGAWRRIQPLVHVRALEGYGPSSRVALEYGPTRDFFFGVLEGLLTEAEGPDGPRSRTASLAASMAEAAPIPMELRDAVGLVSLFWMLGAETGTTDLDALRWAADRLRAWDAPYDVEPIFDALRPRLSGEAGPGGHPGVEILYTARTATLGRLVDGDDPIAVLGSDAARHDGAALVWLAAALRRRGLERRVGEGARWGVLREEVPSDTESPEVDDGAGVSLFASLRRVLRRPAPAPPAVTGRLSDLPLVDLLQTLVRGGRSGRVLILGGAERGEVQVREGRLAGASHGTRLGEEALATLVGSQEGRFEVRFEDGPLNNLAGATELLLLEALRRRDEQRQL